jgi:glycosyltransferase involved in cell wall biosynthesis
LSETPVTPRDPHSQFASDAAGGALSGATEPLRVSLVVPVRDEEASVGELLAGITAQTRRPDETVIVDGGSRDATLTRLRDAAARDSSLRVVEAGEATPGRGRNVGIAAASHDWIALTDAGNRLEPDWLERLVEVVRRDPSVEVVYGNFEPAEETFFESCAALAYPPPKQEREGGRIRGPFIASSLLRREVWRKVGGFPDLRAAEDLMFMDEIERRGFKIVWEPRATVWWQLRPTLASTFRKFVLYSRHNVWAGRARHWHYGVARQYALILPFAALAVAHSAWWLVVPALWLAARTARSIERRREGARLRRAYNPARFCGVMLILLTIDAATFIGWAQALLSRPGAKSGAPASPAPGARKSES